MATTAASQRHHYLEYSEERMEVHRGLLCGHEPRRGLFCLHPVAGPRIQTVPSVAGRCMLTKFSRSGNVGPPTLLDAEYRPDYQRRRTYGGTFLAAQPMPTTCLARLAAQTHDDRSNRPIHWRQPRRPIAHCDDFVPDLESQNRRPFNAVLHSAVCTDTRERRPHSLVDGYYMPPETLKPMPLPVRSGASLYDSWSSGLLYEPLPELRNFVFNRSRMNVIGGNLTIAVVQVQKSHRLHRISAGCQYVTEKRAVTRLVVAAIDGTIEGLSWSSRFEDLKKMDVEFEDGRMRNYGNGSASGTSEGLRFPQRRLMDFRHQFSSSGGLVWLSKVS